METIRKGDAPASLTAFYLCYGQQKWHWAVKCAGMKSMIRRQMTPKGVFFYAWQYTG